MERAILVDLVFDQESIGEMKKLAQACFIEIESIIIQNLDKPHPSTYIGKGKLLEIKQQMEAQDIHILVFNEELTPNQFKHLEDYFDCLILDRTLLILDIFKKRARTKEAILQVKIAELKHLMPRLIGMKASMLHQQGGKGFRGPGEKQLELDQRAIANQIMTLQLQLLQLKHTRQTQRRKRMKSRHPRVCLVGYTNAGKSSLMNCLLKTSLNSKEVSANDRLFETLETATRLIELPGTPPFFLTDTIGFVERLPHHLIEAFQSTLEEIIESDLLILVLDHHVQANDQHLNTINQVLHQLGVQSIPTLIVLNKSDLPERYSMIQHTYLSISAKTGYNIDVLLQHITKELFIYQSPRYLFIPFDKMDDYWYIKKHYHLNEDQLMDSGYFINVSLTKEDDLYLMQYAIQS